MNWIQKKLEELRGLGGNIGRRYATGRMTPGGWLGSRQPISQVKNASGPSKKYALDAETQAEIANNEAEFARQASLGQDPFGDRSSLSPEEQTYIASGQTPDTPMDGGTATQAEEYVPQIVYFNGQTYDVNNEQDRARYFADRSGMLDTQYNEFETGEQDSLRRALEEAGIVYGQQGSSLTQDLTNLGTNRGDYLTGYGQSMSDLGEGYRFGGAKRQNYFSGLGSRAYQSSQGSSQQYADTKYGEAQTAKGQEKTRNLEAFRQSEAGLTQDQTNLGRTYNNYLEESRLSLADKLNRAKQQTDLQRDQISTDLAGIDVAKGFSGMDYNRSAYTPVTAEQIDLGDYTKYTNFDQLAQSPQAKYSQTYKSPTGTATTADPLSQYLGYNPTEKQKNYLLKYLSGKA